MSRQQRRRKDIKIGGLDFDSMIFNSEKGETMTPTASQQMIRTGASAKSYGRRESRRDAGDDCSAKGSRAILEAKVQSSE